MKFVTCSIKVLAISAFFLMSAITIKGEDNPSSGGRKADSERDIEESERILRSNTYIGDAVIEAIRHEDDVVDLNVKTRDVWTLSVGRMIHLDLAFPLDGESDITSVQFLVGTKIGF